MDVKRAIALATRARGKAKRMFLRAPGVKHVADTQYFASLGRHAGELPWLAQDRFSVVKDLRKDWVAKRDGTQFVPEPVLRSASHFVDHLKADKSDRSCVRITPEELAEDATLFTWGLSDENLDLAECYIGLPVHFLGVEVKRERPDGRALDVRQWHIDVEDRRMMKIISYLSDVDPTCGPFNYLDRTTTARAVDNLSYWSGFVPDAHMNSAIPQGEWQQALGGKLTTVFVDTCRLFHRAMPPTQVDRYSMTFSYSSTTPYQVFPEFMQNRKTMMRLRDKLTPRQRTASMMD